VSWRDEKVGQSQTQVRYDRRDHNVSILATVRAALRDDRLLFAFQPVVCATTGKVDYFECLLRMREPEGGIVAGGEFITAIEQLGFIGFIDGYVLKQTVQELSNYPEIRLGLNISSLTACDGRWLRSLILLIRSQPDLARRLIVEITETAALQDIEEAARSSMHCSTQAAASLSTILVPATPRFGSFRSWQWTPSRSTAH